MHFRIGLAALVVIGTVGTAAPAHAEEVRTLTGPGAAGSDMFVTYVGCEDFFGAAAAPQSRLNLGPGAAPLGRRSLGLTPQGTGTASGPYVRFASLAGLDTSVSVTSPGGTSGVSYVWAITPDALPGTAWSGRVATSVPPSGWHHVDPATLTYTWHLVDLATRRPVGDAGQATPAEFAAQHGDGEGYVVTGFGCDGNAVNIDSVRSGASTWDFEGVALDTAIASAAGEVPAGATVTITGRVTDATGRVTGDPLVLETRAPGGAWRAVGGRELVDPYGITRVEVAVRETAEYRWHRPESQYADEGWSEPVTIRTTAPEAPAQPEGQDQQQSDQQQGGQQQGGQQGQQQGQQRDGADSRQESGRQ